MLTEPNIDKQLIISTLDREYGLTVSKLTFIPKGECSWNYKVESSQGVYFLKIHTNPSLPEIRFEWPFKFYNECGIKNIIHPFKTRFDKLAIYFDKFPAVLFNYIEGGNGNESLLTESQYIKLGELIASIHQSYKKLGPYPIEENFQLDNQDGLLKNLSLAKEKSLADPQIKIDFKQLLIKYEPDILNLLKIFNGLGHSLKSQQIDFVICHGDPNLMNLMVDKSGEIFLIDWDDLIFAPKEKDLNYHREHPAVLTGYKNIVGDIQINKDCERCYNLRYVLSEIEGLSSQAFSEEYNEIQFQHYLDGLKDIVKYLD